jgi:hypothetical protein
MARPAWIFLALRAVDHSGAVRPAKLDGSWRKLGA